MQTLIKHKCAVHVVIQFFHQLSQILGGLISASASARCTLSFNFAIWDLGSGIWDLGSGIWDEVWIVSAYLACRVASQTSLRNILKICISNMY